MADIQPDISVISVVAELERMGWGYQFAGEDEVKCRCPAHQDATPSCSISVSKRLFRCYAAGCGATGDFVTFMAIALKTSRQVMLEELGQRYDLREARLIDSETVEKFHARIKDAGPLLKALYDRGLNDDDIRRYRIGFDGKRLTIPIPNEQGAYVNIRRYLPGAPKHEKMKNARGHGQVRLFHMKQLEFDDVIVTGGETKMIVTARMMNPHKIGCITATAGEGNWESAFSPLFKGKRVWVCNDIDDAGIAANGKICMHLYRHAVEVFDVRLPMSRDTYPDGDLSNWWADERKTAEDLLEVLKTAPMWVPPSHDPLADVSEAKVLALHHATRAEHTGRRIAVRGVVQAMEETPYIVPQDVVCECDKDQDFCTVCPVFAGSGKPGEKYVQLRLPSESPAVLEMVNAGKNTQREALRQGLGIPPCDAVQFRAKTHYNVEHAHVTPMLDVKSQHRDSVTVPVMAVGHGIEVGSSYLLTGRVFPHPRNQQAVMLASEAVTTEDALSSFDPGDEELGELSVFKPEAWTREAVSKKLDDVYEDLEANVTRIFRRREVHLAVDLAYHSPLNLEFDGRPVKGWVEVLIVGDSSQGKTEVTSNVSRHYGLGGKIECKNASVPGIIGGLQQLGNKWFVTRGVVPAHDRQLVIMEELKGASTEIISKMTDMRSSGIAMIDKIEKRRMFARTRIIALSNPRSEQPVSTYSYGVNAVSELIGSPEDVRRFDMALVVSSGQVPIEELNKLARERPTIAHDYTSALCNRLVLWSWTRTAEQVRFDEDAVQLALESANSLCEKFVEVVPLVDRGSMRFKVARLAASLACRTFSTDETDLRVVRVRRCHVEHIIAYLDGVYSHPTFGYADFSAAWKSTRTMSGVDEVKGRLRALPFPRDFVESMLHVDSVEHRDLTDWTGWERGEASELLSFLVRKHALVRSVRGYRKTPDFIELLKGLLTEKHNDRPSYVTTQY